MINVVKHGNYTHIKVCPACECKFTYIDKGNSIGNDFQDINYVRDNCGRFLFKYIYCPECGFKIISKTEKDNDTLLNNVKDIEL